MQHATTLDEVLALRSENARLRARVKYLETVLGPHAFVPGALRLSKSKSIILGTLMQEDKCSLAGLKRALYGPGAEHRATNSVYVIIYDLRGTLRAYGVSILFDGCYRITPSDKNKVSRL